MAKRNEQNRIIAVHWLDANSASSWTDQPNSTRLGNIITAGLYVGEDDQVLRVGLNHDEWNNWSDIMSIPKSQIVKRQFIMTIEIDRGK